MNPLRLTKKPIAAVPFSELQFFSLILASAQSSLRVLDLMFLRPTGENKNVSMWLYTTPAGQLLSRDLDSMDVEDLIAAILCNIDGNKQLSHSDIVV